MVNKMKRSPLLFKVLKAMFHETFPQHGVKRIPEPDLIMDNVEKVEAYVRACRREKLMFSQFILNSAHLAEIIKPNDLVLDLGTGPAGQLGMVAKMHPNSHFIGMELSNNMLAHAKEHAENLTNCEILQGDITNLKDFPDKSVDVVMSTMMLHHLNDEKALEQVFKEIARVVKPDGGVYLSDFGLLNTHQAMECIAFREEKVQNELFAQDTLYSLKAAFPLDTFQGLNQQYLHEFNVKLYSTFYLPVFLCLKSKPRNEDFDSNIQIELHKLIEELPTNVKKELKMTNIFFKMNGCSSKYLK